MRVRWLGERQPLFPYPEDVHAWVDEAFSAQGAYAALPRAGADVGVAASPSVVWNQALLDAFMNAATVLPAQLSVARNAMTEHTAWPGSHPSNQSDEARLYDLFLCPRDAPPTTLTDLRRCSHRVCLTLPAECDVFRTPGFGTAPHTVSIPRAAAWVAQVSTWPQLLWLLQGAPHALRSASLGARAVQAGQSMVAKNVRIHGTAYVEASILQEGVEVDAHATVVGSYVGHGVRIADHSALHHCVVGARSQTLADTLLRRVVALSGCTISNLDMTEVLLGRDCFVTAGVIFFGGQPGSTVQIGQAPDAPLDTRRAELGSAVGHSCVLGTRAIFVPGRAIPGRTVVVMRPEEGVMKMPDVQRGTAVAWDSGALVPVAKRWPDYLPPELNGACDGPAKGGVR
jgi:carbonic anhydrase/acetyltransferase-like protein (isoleucine patch superfamily)